MKLHTLMVAVALGVVVPNVVFAHPVSFKGGYGVMPSYTPERKELELNYSLTNSQAIGFNTINLDYEDRGLNFYLPQYSYKLFRRNELDSQMNLYGTVGVGVARYDGDETVAGLAAFQADYETRRVYTLLGGEHLQTGDGIGLNRVRYRLGFAPYLASFEGFHSWLIGQVEYTPELDNEWTVTPLVRFFYQNYLIEVGSSTRGDLFVAGIFHF
jgi:hypothetical protein